MIIGATWIIVQGSISTEVVVRLRISRENLDRARHLASRVNQRLSELELERLDKELTKLQA